MAELNIVEKVIALEGVDLLKNLTPEQLSRIAAIAQEVKAQPGKVLIDSGKTADSLMIVLDGSVELTRDGATLTTARQNDTLGAWALFDDDPLPITATALEDTRLLRIARDDFYDLLSDNMEITAAMFSTIIKRLRQLVER